MQQQLVQVLNRAELNKALVEVRNQVRELIEFAQTHYNEANFNPLYTSASALLSTSADALQVDALIGHVEELVSVRDSIAQNLQTYQAECKSRIAKLMNAINHHVSPSGFKTKSDKNDKA